MQEIQRSLSLQGLSRPTIYITQSLFLRVLRDPNSTSCVSRDPNSISYVFRDPNSVQTLSAFRRGVDWARSGSFSQQDIDEAKLSVFSTVDAPVAPSNKGTEGSPRSLGEPSQCSRGRCFYLKPPTMSPFVRRKRNNIYRCRFSKNWIIDPSAKH